jgi:hypothetical protein
MSQPTRNSRSRKHNRRASFHQRQIRFFSIFFGLIVFLFVAGMLYLLNRSPALVH